MKKFNSKAVASLSDANKALIHQSFSSNAKWPHDWSAYLLDLGLVAWYPFDGNASDMSGNGNHGTVHGATLGTDRHGRAGEAYSFDGVNDHITVPHVNQLDGMNYGLTLSVWLNQTTSSGQRGLSY